MRDMNHLSHLFWPKYLFFIIIIIIKIYIVGPKWYLTHSSPPSRSPPNKKILARYDGRLYGKVGDRIPRSISTG